MLKRRLLEPTHPAAISFFRATYCFTLIAVTLNELWRMPDRYHLFPAYYGPIPPFLKVGLNLPDERLVIGAGILLCLTLAAAAMGIMTRPALAASLVLFLFFFGTVLGWAKTHPTSDRPSDHHTIHVYLLALLLLSPGVGRFRVGKPWTVDANEVAPAWPLLAARAVLAITYLGAAYSKLDDSGLKWLDGYNLQTIFLEKYATLPGLGLGLEIAQHHTLCLLLSIGTLVFELGFVTVLLWPRRHPARWAYVVSGIAFHTSTWAMMGIWQFVASFCAAYLVFLEWPLKKGAPMPARGEAPDRAGELVFATLVTVMLVSVVTRAHFWPLGDFQTYSTYQDYRDQIDITYCERVDHEGKTSPCFGTSSAIGAQLAVHLAPNERVNDGARRWLDDQMGLVPITQRRMLIGRTVRVTVRSFPMVDGRLTVNNDVLTMAQ